MDVKPPSDGPVLYLIVCGAPSARGVPDFVRTAQAQGWRVCVIPTPSGANFVDVEQLAAMTGLPVRTHYKHPSEPDVLPSADVLVVAPATFNTVNKIAQGITDTLGVGLVSEALGYRKPVIIVPSMNRGLACSGPYGRSLGLLEADGAIVVLTATTRPVLEPQTDSNDPLPSGRVAELLISLA